MKKIFSVLVVLSLLFSLTSCGETKGTDAVVSFESTAIFDNIDPQLAETISEKTIAVNCFEGLFRLDKNEVPKQAACKSYTISDDSLTYTFKIRSDMKWEDDTSVTSKDFAFGLKRGLDKNAQCPDATTLFSIRNAKDYFHGTCSADALGISTPDDSTLIITLSEKNDNFLRVLTTPITMPCDEQFFNSTAGKYGLEKQYINTNGPFFVRRWDTEKNTLRMNRSEKYNGNFKSKPAAVGIQYSESTDMVFKNVESGTDEIGLIDSKQAIKANSETLNLYNFFTSSYSLFLNPHVPDSNNEGIKKALIASIDTENIAMNLPSVYKFSNSVIPVDLGKDITARRASTKKEKNSDFSAVIAKNTFNSSTNIEKFDIKELYYIDIQDMSRIANEIVSSWQVNFGIVVNPKAVTLTELSAAITEGSCSIAITPLTNIDGTVTDFFSSLTTGASNNYLNFSSTAFDSKIKSAKALSDGDEKNDLFIEAENIIFDSKQLLPLFSTPISFVTAKSINGINFVNLGEYLDFTSLIKIEK